MISLPSFRDGSGILCCLSTLRLQTLGPSGSEADICRCLDHGPRRVSCLRGRVRCGAAGKVACGMRVAPQRSVPAFLPEKSTIPRKAQKTPPGAQAAWPTPECIPHRRGRLALRARRGFAAMCQAITGTAKAQRRSSVASDENALLIPVRFLSSAAYCLRSRSSVLISLLLICSVWSS